MMVLVFSGDKWIPEYLPHETIDGYPGEFKYYSESGKYVRSGRPFFIDEEADDYERFIDDLGPSRHYTVIFNTFVFCQVFNFINARKIHEESNIFGGITQNLFFIVIVLGIAGLQLIIGNLGGRVFSVSNHAQDVRQWLICIGFGAFSLLWGMVLKMIPVDKLCPKVIILL